MARPRNRLNPEILRDRLPDNYRQVVDQAERNVNLAVDQLVGDYEQRLNLLATQLEEGTFPDDFRSELSKIDAQWNDNLRDLDHSVSQIKAKAEQLLQTPAAGAALLELADGLTADAQRLQTRLNAVRGKVKQVGTLSGKVLGTALRKLVTGGV